MTSRADEGSFPPAAIRGNQEGLIQITLLLRDLQKELQNVTDELRSIKQEIQQKSH